MSSVKEYSRFTEIDLLRFCSALAVVLFHYTFRGFASNDFTVRAWFPGLSSMAKYGFLGFHLFFIISGFVILMTAMEKTPQQFVISRVVRLYPAYWACCILTFVITLIFGKALFKVTLFQLSVNMTMLQGFFNISPVDGVYWTLFIELKFYIFIFMILIANQLRYIQYYLGAWLLLSVLSAFHHIPKFDDLCFPEYSAYFIAGAEFFLIYKQGNSFYKSFLVVVSLFLVFYRANAYCVFASSHYHASFQPTVTLGLIGLFFLIFYLISQRRTSSVRCEYFVFLGSLTYPLYLLHDNLGLISLKLLNGSIDRRMLLISIMVGALVLAYLVHIKVEKKICAKLKEYLERIFNVRPPREAGAEKRSYSLGAQDKKNDDSAGFSL